MPTQRAKITPHWQARSHLFPSAVALITLALLIVIFYDTNNYGCTSRNQK